jgi:hypothetical protein
MNHVKTQASSSSSWSLSSLYEAFRTFIITL